MNARWFTALVGILCSWTIVAAQVPSVQLKVKDKSGFLGMGGARNIQIDLSNQLGKAPFNCETVQGGPYYYFLVAPSGVWQLDESFVSDDMEKVSIVQGGQKFPILWKGDILPGGNNSLLIGFSKKLHLQQPFTFQSTYDDPPNTVDMNVPQEYWIGYSHMQALAAQADSAMHAGAYKAAIVLYERLLNDSVNRLFTTYTEFKEKRAQSYLALYQKTWSEYEVMLSDTLAGPKLKIARIDEYRPAFQYYLDSLPRAEWNIGSLDSSIAPVVTNSRAALLRMASYRDSLQHVLDAQNIDWILNGSTTLKNGNLYTIIIESLASTYSLLDYSDSLPASLHGKLPEEFRARLIKYNIDESYDTFVRIADERYRMHLPIFPVGFLPNLRKDTSGFPLPYYSMLKAVNDFLYENNAGAKAEIAVILRTCYEPDYLLHFDQMRVTLANKEHPVSADIERLLAEAKAYEGKKDFASAIERYQQVASRAPTFALGFYKTGKFYARTGDPIRALYSYQRAYQADSTYLTAYRECYMQYLRQSNYKEMLNVLLTAVSKGNEMWEIYYNLGIAYLGDVDPAHAIPAFEHALALNGHSYRANIQLGLAYQSIKNYQKAREYFNNAIGLDPTRNEAVDYLTKLNDMQRQGK